MTKNKTWLLTFAAAGIAAGIAVSSVTVHIDPFMHYHKPLTDEYYYSLDNQRSQNAGITKNFDYDGLITGTSMTENFRTTEANRIYDANFIKVPYSGGRFREINDDIALGLKTHPGMKYVIRSLDRYAFNNDKDMMRDDLGKFPTYLYDSNPFNDVEYFLNRNVIYSRDWNMYENAREEQQVGITSFDDYANWMAAYTFGEDTVLHTVFEDDDSFAQGFTVSETKEKLTDEEKKTIYDNVTQNITSLADRYPDTEFDYFFPPYSAAYWGTQIMAGTMEKEIEIERYAASLIVPHENIHLFLWNRFDILDDLNNYKDTIHYGEWVNSWMLVQMKNDSGRLTENNYDAVFDEEYEHYKSFDYNSLFSQTDNEADYYISGLMNKEISGTEPFYFNEEYLKGALLNASVVSDQYEGTVGIDCRGAMARASGDPKSVSDSMRDGDFSGAMFTFDASDYRALTWYGRKVQDHGRVTVYMYDSDGNLIRSVEANYPDLDDQWHQYAINLDGVYEDVTVIMNGAYIDSTGSPDSEYVFSDIVVY